MHIQAKRQGSSCGVAVEDCVLASPMQVALMLALTLEMKRRGRHSEATVESWLYLMGPLFDTRTRKCTIQEHPQTAAWARKICIERGWKELLGSEEGLYEAMGRYFFEQLCRVASIADRDHTNTPPGQLVSQLRAADWSNCPAARNALAELDKHRSVMAASACPFVVLRDSNGPAHEIELEANMETTAVDGFRIRPHAFRLHLQGDELLREDSYLVAQLWEPEEVDQTAEDGATTWDTIWHNNGAFPFWPVAGLPASQEWCHRCSLHRSGSILQWSDWPQLLPEKGKALPLKWHFNTAVWASGLDSSRRRIYRMIAQRHWSIDWTK